MSTNEAYSSLDLVEPYLDANGKVAPGDFNRVKNALHTDIVADIVARLSQNRILPTRLPLIDSSEKQLPHIVRSTLFATTFRVLLLPSILPAQNRRRSG